MPGSLFSPGGILTPRRDFLLTGGGLALAGYSLSMRPGIAHAARLAGGNPSPVDSRANCPTRSRMIASFARASSNRLVSSVPFARPV